ncbi:LysM peptidoglycan-binding domain-containing protein [Geomesophilobacter sediminis]|uniref:Tetratricopeptide repeat protein n=1 Tax=Geomesophilobacter sediminis TaxID=2798584 RepID=A0A8J7S6N6_9BACT|nr:tetratricopeptide repeat protein [Geomesophilobacter sediminis]MBJ6726521.1 tetratricopeptide repeat protein [Geomesophilobacter sediminis]
MKKRLLKTVCRVVPILLLPCLCLGEEYLLYEPKPATGAEAGKDKGVLVKSVTVQPGDTLKRIARRHIGKDWLFPQVLLFNKVPNPDLIHPGDKLYVPVSGESSGGAKTKVGKRTHLRGKAKHHRKESRKRVPATRVSIPPAAPEAAAPAVEPVQPTPAVPPVERKKERRSARKAAKSAVAASRPAGSAADAQSLYQSARKAYLQGNYRRAASLFSDFLKSYPDSPVAADASLYRADCYLQLSQQ